MKKDKLKEKFNPNKTFKNKYHVLYWDLDGKRPPPKSIIWYLNISILISISIWFIPESINQYAITHYFIDFMQTLVPKIAQFKELAYEGHISKTMPFYVSLIWFWILATFLPLLYVQNKFISKKVLLSDFEYYDNKFFRRGVPLKILILIIFFTILFPYLIWIASPGNTFGFSFRSTYQNFIGVAIWHGLHATMYYFISSIIIAIKSKIILRIFKHNKEKTNEQ